MVHLELMWIYEHSDGYEFFFHSDSEILEVKGVTQRLVQPDTAKCMVECILKSFTNDALYDQLAQYDWNSDNPHFTPFISKLGCYIQWSHKYLRVLANMVDRYQNSDGTGMVNIQINASRFVVSPMHMLHSTCAKCNKPK
jgi:hypothetical protein